MSDRFVHRRLHELSVFEAAGRCGSFSSAGRELGMTQSAVSHHIANLEQELGLRLFLRVWRGVTLTEAGAVLFEAMRRGLDTIGTGLTAARAAARPPHLTVVTDFCFAAFWLIPRLDEVRRITNGIDAHIVTTQASEAVELMSGDAAIAFGVTAPSGWEVTRLVDETVVPVASPQLIARLKLQAPEDLLRAPLLHLAAPNPGRWMSWRDYVSALGLGPRHQGADLSFNNYPLLMQAAMAGQGVALGWQPLINDLVASGLVAPLLRPVHAGARGYDLIVPPGGTRTVALANFKDWLIREFTRDTFGRCRPTSDSIGASLQPAVRER